MLDVICLGELLIDLCSTVPDVSVAEAPGFTRAAGGAPANVAVAARRLGAASGFIGAVGDDPFGEYLAGVLAREGVDTRGLVRLAGGRTPLAFVAVHSDGASDFFFYHDAGLAPLRPEHVDEQYIASAAALHFGSISRIEETARAATDKARDLARQHGLLICYDPTYRPRLWATDESQRRQRLLEGFDGTTLVKLSSEEWRFLLGAEEFASGARRFFDRGVELVVRSEGGEGASFAAPAAAGHVPGFRVRSVEFTGAGDAFVGSLLADLTPRWRSGIRPGQLSQADLTAIVRRANAVGALTTTRPGAIPAMPTREQVDQFLRNVGT